MQLPLNICGCYIYGLNQSKNIHMCRHFGDHYILTSRVYQLFTYHLHLLGIISDLEVISRIWKRCVGCKQVIYHFVWVTWSSIDFGICREDPGTNLFITTYSFSVECPLWRTLTHNRKVFMLWVTFQFTLWAIDDSLTFFIILSCPNFLICLFL